MPRQISSHYGSQEIEKGDTGGLSEKIDPQGHTPSDLLYPTRLHLLHFLTTQ